MKVYMYNYFVYLFNQKDMDGFNNVMIVQIDFFLYFVKIMCMYYSIYYCYVICVYYKYSKRCCFGYIGSDCLQCMYVVLFKYD